MTINKLAADIREFFTLYATLREQVAPSDTTARMDTLMVSIVGPAKVDDGQKLSYGEPYFCVTREGNVIGRVWRGSGLDLARGDVGNVYRTRKEALAHKPK